MFFWSYEDCVKQRVIENRSMFHLTAHNLCRLVACAIRRLAVRQLTQNQNAMIGKLENLCCQRTSGHSPKAQGESGGVKQINTEKQRKVHHVPLASRC